MVTSAEPSERGEPGAFRPGTVLGWLAPFNVDHQVLQRLHRVVRELHGLGPPPGMREARHTYFDVACTLELVRIIVEQVEPGSGKPRFATAKLAKDLQELRAIGFRYPLLQARLSYRDDRLCIVDKSAQAKPGDVLFVDPVLHPAEFMRYVYQEALDEELSMRLRDEYARAGVVDVGTFADRYF